jgi:hypothetical protein
MLHELLHLLRTSNLPGGNEAPNGPEHYSASFTFSPMNCLSFNRLRNTWSSPALHLSLLALTSLLAARGLRDHDNPKPESAL